MGEVVICARVARAIALQAYRRDTDLPLEPAKCVYAGLARVPLTGMPMLRFALHSLIVYLDIGMTSSVWLRNVLEAAHYGSSFRRCFFFDYKENRRPYPRVTNRGVQTSIEARPLSTRRRQLDA